MVVTPVAPSAYVIARETAALNGLYNALEPAQRQSLVDTVRERHAERATKWASHRQEIEANGGWGQQRLAHLTTELGLDAAQQQAVQTIMTANRPAPAVREAKHEAMKERNEAMLTAFTSDSFDATQFAPSVEGQMGPGQHAQFLAKLVPISQIVYGTDYPYFALNQIDSLRQLGLPQPDLDAIANGNAARLVPRLSA